MDYPLKNYYSYQQGYYYGYPYPAGFGSLTGQPHLGQDVVCPMWTEVIAPDNGEVINTVIGTQGGRTLWFKDSKGHIWRFLHLVKEENKGKYKQGDVVAWTGNSGLSKQPHLHFDIFKTDDTDDLSINNFIDPIKYIKENLMSQYHNHIIRNQDDGSFAYVINDKKQIITRENSGLALITYLQRMDKNIHPKEWIQNVSASVFNSINNTPTLWF
jgi:hypothetical protein